MTIILSAHPDRFGCGTAKSLFLTVWMQNIGARMFGHSLDASLLVCKIVANFHTNLYTWNPHHTILYVEQNTLAYFAFDDRVGYSLAASEAPSPPSPLLPPPSSK
jgi:hypothetical protein